MQINTGISGLICVKAQDENEQVCKLSAIISTVFNINKVKYTCAHNSFSPEVAAPVFK